MLVDWSYFICHLVCGTCTTNAEWEEREQVGEEGIQERVGLWERKWSCNKADQNIRWEIGVMIVVFDFSVCISKTISKWLSAMRCRRWLEAADTPTIQVKVTTKATGTFKFSPEYRSHISPKSTYINFDGIVTIFTNFRIWQHYINVSNCKDIKKGS